MADGRIKHLELSWSPICSEHGTVDKIMVCVRDVTQLRQLEAEAEQQKRELQMIGQILAISQEKFDEFVASARRFIADNEALLQAGGNAPDLAAQLFRNMHTIKGNARTYGLLQLTNIVHQAEQAYDDLRRGTPLDQATLLKQLHEVSRSLDEYASLNADKLGRKGPGRRGSAEKYVMVERARVDKMVAGLTRAIDLHVAQPELAAPALKQLKLDLQRIGTEPIETILDNVFASLPSLASELGKEAPRLKITDNGIFLRQQIADVLRNVFMHLYRNSLDHGIEEVADRFLAGKHPAGTIALDLALAGEQLVMRLRDDGRGLALGAIRSKAIDRGLLAEDSDAADEAVAQLIFAAGFSTAQAVTEVSGRGVGMDAVQDFVKREGGEIRLAFIDDQAGADFRAFETVICLPGKYAVSTARVAEPRPVSDDLRSPVSSLVLPARLAVI